MCLAVEVLLIDQLMRPDLLHRISLKFDISLAAEDILAAVSRSDFTPGYLPLPNHQNLIRAQKPLESSARNDSWVLLRFRLGQDVLVTYLVDKSH